MVCWHPWRWNVAGPGLDLLDDCNPAAALIFTRSCGLARATAYAQRAMRALRRFLTHPDGHLSRREGAYICGLFLRPGLVLAWLGSLVTAGSVSAATSNPSCHSIAELHEATANRGRVVRSFQFEGVVCAALPERGLIALQDDTAAVLLEVASLGGDVRVGQRVVVVGDHCTLTRTDTRLQAGTGPVVDHDGRHPPTVKAGSVFLQAGLQPIRVEWFNSHDSGLLRVAYEGPGVTRQKIPSDVLRRRHGDGTFQPGLDYATYVGDEWIVLPDFAPLKPVASGTVTNFDVSRRARPAHSAMVFTGFLQVQSAGSYTFHIESDDGSRLFAGDAAASCTVRPLAGETVSPRVMPWEQALAERKDHRWVVAEGEVTFVSRRGQRLELDLHDRGMTWPVSVVDGVPLFGTNLLHRRVRVTGIGVLGHELELTRSARLITPGAGQVRLLESPDALTAADVLTTAAQIRHLSPAEARKPYRARLRGVVAVTSPDAFVLQDDSGGIFVHYTAPKWEAEPRPGEVWEIEGRTDPGNFSPIIYVERAECLGTAALPEGVRPIWEQLMNGSLDSELVELEAVVIADTPEQMVLLTRDGRIKINNHDFYPLPRLATGTNGPSLRGSVVRLRGVLFAGWNLQTGLMRAGEFFLGNALLSVDEAPPADPYAAPARHVTDLLRFTSHPDALKRVKVAGQILHVEGNENFLTDGTNGLRFFAQEPLSLQEGDLVEAVGFPRLGGPSPVLLEAVARRTGQAPPPAPMVVSSAQLSERGRDSTRVQVEAVLLSDTVRKEERVLELQSGPHLFLGRLRSDAGMGPSLVPGSRLQLTGVYAGARDGQSGGGGGAFELLLGAPRDIVVLQRGPWWTLWHTIAVIGVLSGGLALTLVWVSLLRKTVAQRTAQLQREITERQLVEQHRAMEAERTRVAQDLHDELGAGLTEVTILTSLAKNPAIPPERKEGYLDQIGEAANSLVTGLDEIVWAVNPQYDSTASLASYYSLFAQRFLNLADIACRLRVTEPLVDHALDSRVRHSIFLAFKEALNNIVRHSGATEVQLAIGTTAGELRISLADNGRGFATDAATAPAQDGLGGMRSRMESLGGSCEITSEPGRGTTVAFVLPLKQTKP